MSDQIMERMIFNISPSFGYMYFLFWVVFAGFMGFVVFKLLTNSNSVRAQFRGMFQSTSKRTATICAVISALPFIAYGYYDSWSHFYSVSIDSGKLVVGYLVPARRYEMQDLTELEVSTASEVRKGVWYRIKLVGKTGPEFTSQLMDRREYDVNFLALKKELQKAHDLTKSVDTDASKPAAQVTP